MRRLWGRAGYAVWLAVLLAATSAGCGQTGGGDDHRPTTSAIAGTSAIAEAPETAGAALQPEPSGPETAAQPTNRGLAISLGGPPSGRGGASGSFYSFSEQHPTWCVPIGSGTIPELSAMPPGMSVGVTVTIQSNPAHAFVASDSSGCQVPCDTYTFTTIRWHCETGVTWNGEADAGGGLSIGFTAYCGTADESACKKWAATNYTPDGLELGAHATGSETTSTATTSSAPTSTTSASAPTSTSVSGPATTTSQQPSGAS